MDKCNHGLWNVPAGWRDTGLMRDGRCLVHYADTGIYCLWDGAALKSCDQHWAEYADLAAQLGTQRYVSAELGMTEAALGRKVRGLTGVTLRDVMAMKWLKMHEERKEDE